MAGETSLPRIGESGLIVPDGTARVLEELRDDPEAYVGCLYHPNMTADVVFATPEGTKCDLEAMISPFCGQHIIEEDVGPMIPLIDLTGGWWSEKRGYEPLLTRDTLDKLEDVLREVFSDPVKDGVEHNRIQRILSWLRLDGKQ